MKSKSRFEF